jgi:hypothetical protein
MIKYTIVIMILFYISIGIEIASAFKSDGSNDFLVVYYIFYMLFMTPIFGRILGWW